MSLLSVANLTVSFGGVHAVRDVSFDVDEGEIFSIIGPNGAGKTTIFNLISGYYGVDSGTVTFNGQDITGVATHQVAKLGIARTFQNTELFEHETVLENLLIAHHIHRRTFFLEEMLFLPRIRRQDLEFRRHAEDIIDLLDLQRYREREIRSLPHGIRKMVELARALCMRPKILLLDEPSSGLNPEETEDISFWIEDISEDLQTTLIMVEHDMNLVGQLSDRVLAMADGVVLTIGTPDEVKSDPSVQQAYMGE